VKPASKWEIIAIVALWLGVAAWFAVKFSPLAPDRVPGLRAAMSECQCSDDEKREIARVFNETYAKEFASHIRADKTIATAQQASRTRHAFAKTVFAGRSYCHDGCRFRPLAEVSTNYLSTHLGVAKDYKLDDPCPSLPGFTWREKWARVHEVLGVAHVEVAP
jgi:hypothetical protein